MVNYYILGISLGFIIFSVIFFLSMPGYVRKYDLNKFKLTFPEPTPAIEGVKIKQESNELEKPMKEPRKIKK